ncbi:MAG: hypothetical protein EBV89_07990, partial [Betaproteobacteria bacterium]|nr:hypothetical protein [Betaproteobacteria bacterium]
STASVALANGINANLLRRWVAEWGDGGRRLEEQSEPAALTHKPEFVRLASEVRDMAAVNRRCNRIKILVHDGLGVWLAARRLNRGRFVWTRSAESTVQMNTSQLGALAMGLPWQRLGDAGIIAVI